MAWIPHDPLIIREFASALAVHFKWTLSSCQPWKEGASNAIWAMDTVEGRFVLKIGKLEYWRRLAVEEKVLKVLDGTDAPRFIAGGQAGVPGPNNMALPWDWAVLERVEGFHPFNLSPDEARDLGSLLARVRVQTHGLDLVSGSWRDYRDKRILGAIEVASKGISEPLAGRFTMLMAAVDARQKYGDCLDSLPTGICHGDLTPLNLVKKENGGFSLLDWEQPRRASVAWDLAGVRKSFRLSMESFAALRAGLGETVDDESIAFADALYQLHVASWRAEMWFGREQRHYGDFFLIELGEELGRAELLLRSLNI